MSIFNDLPELQTDPISTATQKPLDPKTNLPVGTKTSGGTTGGIADVLYDAKPFDFQTEPESKRVTLPDTYENYSRYLTNINHHTDLDELRSSAQGFWGKTGNSLLRALPVTGAKFVQGFSGVAGFAITPLVTAWELASTGDITEYSWSTIWDNALMNAATEFEDATKQYLPIYKSNQYKYGSSWDKMWTADYWTEDVADAVEFLASAWGGGLITKPLQVGGKLMQSTGFGRKLVEASKLLPLGKEASLAQKAGRAAMTNWDNIVVTAYNTIGEASIESRETYKNLMHQYEAGEWGQGLSVGEAKRQASGRALETFGFNTAVLVGPNFLQSKWFGFGSDKLAKTEIAAYMANTAKTSKKSILGNFVKGIVAEGLWEEGMQSAIQNFEMRAFQKDGYNKDFGTRAMDKLSGIVTEYGKGFSRTDDQLAMITGALIGGGMGVIGTFVERKQMQDKFNKLTEVLGISDLLYNNNYMNLFEQETVDQLNDDGTVKKDAAGQNMKVTKVKLDAAGQPQYNYEAIARLFQSLLIEDSLITESMAATLKGDNIHKDIVEKMALSRLAVQYFDIDYGMEILEIKLEKLAEEKAKNSTEYNGATEIMKALEVQKQDIYKMKELWDKSKSSKRLISTDPDAVGFNGMAQNAEFYIRHMLSNMEAYKNEISSRYSLDLMDSSAPGHAAATKKLEHVDSLIADYNDSLNQLTIDQDELFKEYKQAKGAKDTFVQSIKDFDTEYQALQQAKDAVNANTTLDDAAKKVELDALELQLDELTNRSDAYIFENTLNTTIQAKLKALNSIEWEGKRLAKDLTIKENIFYRLGLNLSAVNTIREMIADKQPFDKIINAIRDSGAIPTQALIDALQEAVQSTNAVDTLSMILNNSIQDYVNLIKSLESTTLRDNLYNELYPSKTPAEAQTELIGAFLKGATTKKQDVLFMLVYDSDPTFKADFDAAFVGEDLLMIDIMNTYTTNKQAYKDSNETMLEITDMLDDIKYTIVKAMTAHAAGNIAVRDKFLADVDDIIQDIIATDLADTDKFVNDINSDKDITSRLVSLAVNSAVRLMEEANPKSKLDALDNYYLADTVQARMNYVIGKLLRPGANQKVELEIYFTNEKIVETNAFLDSINEEEFTDDTSLLELIGFFNGAKVYFNGATIEPEIQKLIDRLEAIRAKAIENQGNKQRQQNHAYTVMIMNMLSTANVWYDMKTEKFVLGDVNDPLYKLLMTHATADEKKLFDEILARTKVKRDTADDTAGEISLIEASDYLIIEHILTKVPKAEVDTLIKNEANGVAEYLVGLPEGSTYKKDIFVPALLSNPYSVLGRIITMFDRELGKFSSTHPVIAFSKHRDVGRLVRELRAFPAFDAFSDTKKKELLDEIERIIGFLYRLDNIQKTLGIAGIDVVERFQKEQELIDAAIATNGYLPTVEQLIAIRQLYGRVKTGARSNHGSAYIMLTNGTLGTGKTEMLPKWLISMLNIMPANVIAFGHNENTSKQIAEKLGTTQTSFEEFMKLDVPATTELIVFDEIHTLTHEQLSDLSKKLKEVNDKRTKKVFLLGLGDPYQITAENKVSPIYGLTNIGKKSSEFSYAEVFETSPLTVRYRSSVVSINSFVDKFYGKNDEVGRITGTVSSDGTTGVTKLSDYVSVVNKIKNKDIPDKVTSAIVVSNKDLKDKYAAQLQAEGVDYFDMEDPKRNKFTGQTVQLYLHSNVGGITVDRVYVEMNISDFADSSYYYNTAMYTALGRATELITVVGMDNVNSETSDIGTTRDIDKDIAEIKATLLVIRDIETDQISKLNPAAVTVKPPTKTPPAADDAVVTPDPLTPPPGSSAVPPKDTTTPALTEEEIEELDETSDDIIIEDEEPPIDEPPIIPYPIVDTHFIPKHPKKAGLIGKSGEVAGTPGTEVIVIPHNGKVKVLAVHTVHRDGTKNYVEIAQLGKYKDKDEVKDEIQDLKDAGVLPADFDISVAGLIEIPGSAFRVNSDSSILATGTISGLQTLRFNYSENTTAKGEDVIKQAHEAAKQLGIAKPSITIKIFKRSGDTDNVTKLNAKFKDKGFTLKAGFPYAVITDEDFPENVFYVRLKARKINSKADAVFFTALNKMITAIETITGELNQRAAKEVRLQTQAKEILSSISLGDYVFNTVLNRMKDLITIDGDGNLKFSTVAAHLKSNIEASIDYLVNTTILRGSERVSILESYLMNRHPEMLAALTADAKAKLIKTLVVQLKAKFRDSIIAHQASAQEILFGYYGKEFTYTKFVVSKINSAGVAKTEDAIAEEVRLEKVKVLGELRTKFPKLKLDSLEFVKKPGTSDRIEEYYLENTADTGTDKKFKSYKLKAGLGTFQKYLNKLAKANTRIGDFTFMNTRKIREHQVRVSKGFLSMETDKSVTNAAGAIRLFYLYAGKVTPTDDLNVTNIEQHIQIVKDKFAELNDSANGYAAFKAWRDEISLVREASGLPALREFNPTIYAEKIQKMQGVINELEDKSDTSPVDDHIKLSDLKNIAAVDTDGNHAHLRAQLNIHEFNVHGSAMSTPEAQAFMNVNLESSFDSVSPTMVSLKLTMKEAAAAKTPFTDLLDDLNNDNSANPFDFASPESLLSKDVTSDLGASISFEEAHKIAKQLLPDLQEDELKFLNEVLSRDGRKAFGKMIGGIIELERTGDTVKKNVLLHEIFHKIWNYYLTPAEREQVTKLYRDKYGYVTDVEERLALDFQIWRRGKSAVRKPLLTRIFDRILKFFGLVNRHHNNIESLFENIHAGMYSKKLTADASLERNMLSLLQDFDNDTTIYNLANQILNNMMSRFTDPNLSQVPLPTMEATIKVFSILTGKESFGNLYNIRILDNIVKAYKHINSENINSILTDLNSHVADIVNGKAVKTSEFLNAMGVVTPEHQLEFVKSLLNGTYTKPLFKYSVATKKLSLNVAATAVDSVIASELPNYQNLQTAFEKLTDERVFFGMMEDLDKSTNFKVSKPLLAKIAKGIVRGTTIEEAAENADEVSDVDLNQDQDSSDSTVEEVLAELTAFAKLYEQIIENDRVDREKSISVKVKMFLARQYLQETDSAGRAIIVDGKTEYAKDIYGFKIPVDKRWAYYTLLNIMQHLDFSTMPPQTDFRDWLKGQLDIAKNKTTRSNLVGSLITSLKEIIDIGFSNNMNSGKIYLGNLRFINEDTFVFTDNFYDMFYNVEGRKRTLYREFHDRAGGMITSVELASDKRFQVVRIGQGETHEDFINRIVRTKFLSPVATKTLTSGGITASIGINRMPNINVGVGNTPKNEPLIKLEVDSKGRLSPSILSNANSRSGELTYVDMYNDDGAIALTAYVKTELPAKVAAERNRILGLLKDSTEDTIIIDGTSYNIKTQRSQMLAVLDQVIKANLINEKVMTDLIANNYKIAYTADLVSNITTNFINQQKQNFHYVEQEFKRGRMTTRVGMSATLNVTQTYKSDVKVSLMNFINGLNGNDLAAKIKNFESIINAAKNKVNASYITAEMKALKRVLNSDTLKEIDIEAVQAVLILQELGIVNTKNKFVVNFAHTDAVRLLDDFDGFIGRIKDNLSKKVNEEEITETETEDILNEELDNSSSLLSSIVGSITDYQDKQVNPSIVDPEGKRRFMFAQKSWGTDVLKRFTSRRLPHLHSVKKLNEQKDSINNDKDSGMWVEETDLFFTLNPILTDPINISKKPEHIVHDGFKLGDNYVTAYSNESAIEWTKRQFNGYFLGEINVKEATPTYIQTVWTISSKKMTTGLRLPVKSASGIKDYLKSDLRQFLLRGKDTKNYIQYFKEDRYVNFDILTQLIEAGNANAIVFDDAVRSGAEVSEALLDRLSDDLYNEITSITDVFINELKERTFNLNSNLVTIYKALVDAKVITSSLSKETLDSLRDTEFIIRDSNNDFVYAFTDVEKESDVLMNTVLKELLDVFITNQYAQSYSLNQLLVGDFAYAKNAFDVIKRMSGVFGMGVAPGMMLATGETFDLLIGTDVSSVVMDAIFKNTKVEGVSGKIMDAAGYMLPERREQLSQGLSKEYNMGYVTKPALYSIAKVYTPILEQDDDGNLVQSMKNGKPMFKIKLVPVMLKESVVSLEDDMCLKDINGGDIPSNWTPHGVLRHNMRKLGVQEFLANSGVKLGAPSKEFLADTVKLFTDPEYYKTLQKFRSLHTRTLRNADYRMQFNPDSQEMEQKVPNASQLPYFLNILSENAAQSERVYKSLAFLISKGREKLEALEAKSQDNGTVDFIKNQVTAAISSPDALRLKDMLQSGINPGNPSVVTKYVNYLASFFSKKTVEIKFPGNKLVLMSAFGFMNLESSNAFKNVTLTKQLAKYSEEKAKKEKPTLDELMSGLKYVEETYIDSSGKPQTRMYAQVLVPQEWAQFVKIGDYMHGDALAYRVPTSELHSAVPLKVVGFLTTKRTNLIVVPKELVHLHGSDFDVDSLFVIRRETYGKLYDKTGSAYIRDIQSEFNTIQSRGRAANSIIQDIVKSLKGVHTDETKANQLELFLNQISDLSTDINKLSELGRKRADDFKALYDSNTYDYSEIEKMFNAFLNSDGSKFIAWTELRKKEPTLTLSLEPATGNNKTVLQTMLERAEKKQEKFNLNYLRSTFSIAYSNNEGKELRWMSEQEEWEDSKALHSNTIKSLNNEVVNKKTGEVERYKGQIILNGVTYGRWYPFVKKTDEHIELEKKIKSSKVDINQLNSLLPDDVINPVVDTGTDNPIEALSKLKQHIREQSRELTAVYTEVMNELDNTRDKATPVGYEYKKVRILTGRKIVDRTTNELVDEYIEPYRWILDDNFESKVSRMDLSKAAKSTLLEKYRKNIITETILEIITADRNRKRMFSPIQLSAFNAEDETTEETGLFAEGTVFRYLQDILLRDAEYAEKIDKAPNPDREKQRIIRLRKVTDMSNFLNQRESFLSNFEGLGLTGVFANSMKSVAYIVKSGYTFYETVTTATEVVSVNVSKKSKGKELSSSAIALKTFAQEVVDKKLEIHALNRESGTFYNEFLKLITELIELENKVKHYKDLLQTGLKDTLDTTFLESDVDTIEIPVLKGSGVETYLEPLVRSDGGFVTIDDVDYFKIVDRVENWELFDALLNAAVDNVKEQILPIINANSLTANAVALALMVNIDIKTISLLMNQPAIKHLNTYQYGANERRVELTLSKLYLMITAKEPTFEGDKVTNLTTTELEEGFVLQHKATKLEDLTIEQLKTQYQALLQYKRLSTVGEALFKLSRALSVLKDLPVFVDDIMNNMDDWKAIGTFDADYKFTPNPSFPLFMGNWLERLPHIVEAVRVRDFLYNKVRQLYMHSEEFTSKVDNITGMPDLSEGKGGNRNIVRRRFELIKFISSSIYDTANEPAWKFTATTARGKASPRTYTGVKAFSQRFLHNLYIIKDWAKSTDLTLNPKLKMFLNSLEVGKNRYSEYYVRFTGGVNINYALLLDLENGFNELNNVFTEVEGTRTIKSVSVVDNEVQLEDKDAAFTEIQEGFMKFAAINYGLSAGITNYTTVLPLELLLRLDAMLEDKVNNLRVPISFDDNDKITVTVLDNIIDLFKVNLVANHSSLLPTVVGSRHSKPDKTLVKINATTNTQPGDQNEPIQIYSGYEEGTFYDLRVVNIASQLTEDDTKYDEKARSTYPMFIRFGSYNTAYIRVNITNGYVYYKQIGINPTQVYDLNDSFITDPYYIDDYFDPRELTVIASNVAVNKDKVQMLFNSVIPKWLQDYVEANPNNTMYATTSFDTDKRNRVKVANVKVVNGVLTGTLIPDTKVTVKQSALVSPKLNGIPIVNVFGENNNSAAKGVINRFLKTTINLTQEPELSPNRFGDVQLDLTSLGLTDKNMGKVTEQYEDVTYDNGIVTIVQPEGQSALERAMNVVSILHGKNTSQKAKNALLEAIIYHNLKSKQGTEATALMERMDEMKRIERIIKSEDPTGFWEAYSKFIRNKVKSTLKRTLDSAEGLNEVKVNGVTSYLNTSVDPTSPTIEQDLRTVFNSLTAIIKANPTQEYTIPVELFKSITLNRKVLPLLQDFVQSTPNIKLVINTADVELFKAVRKFVEDKPARQDNPINKC